MKFLMPFVSLMLKSRNLGPTFTPSTTVSSTHKSLVAREETVNDEDLERLNRVLVATVRVLCSWLAEETSASRDEASSGFLLEAWQLGQLHPGTVMEGNEIVNLNSQKKLCEFTPPPPDVICN